jgi:ABC-type glycerol-3-phosphate transport system substrate-binding protein
MKNVIQVTVVFLLSCFVAGMVLVGVPTRAEAEDVVLKATLAAPKDRWDLLVPAAMEELKSRHPDQKIDIEYEVLPYDKTREKLLAMMAAGTENDLISVDCIWLGEFAEGGFLEDLTDQINQWDGWMSGSRKTVRAVSIRIAIMGSGPGQMCASFGIGRICLPKQV